MKRLNHKNFNKAIVRIKPSGIVNGEVGIFAVRNIKKGSIVGDATKLGEDYFLPRSEYEKIDKKTQRMVRDFCAADVKGFYVPRDINHISILWHFNHCCNGNIGFDKKGNFIAIKNIKEGEELCYDCALLISDPSFKLNCKCGSNNCRKVITGNDWKNSEFIKNNYEYMVPEIKILAKSILKNKN